MNKIEQPLDLLNQEAGMTVGKINLEEQKDVFIIKLPNTKEEIDGFGYWELSNIFWWFRDRNKILYHYRYSSGEVAKTQYLDLPENITKKTYVISEYLEKENSLLLTAI